MRCSRSVSADDPILLISNPAAGRGRARRLAPVVARLLAENGVLTELVESKAKGDIETMAGQAAEAGHRRLIVAGGDGTIQEAVNGILKSGIEVALGVIPTGTGNDFVKSCAIPLYYEHATSLLADRITSDAKPIRLDVGRMNDRYFVNGAGIGFDARVSAIAESIRLPLGDLVYLVALVRALRQGVPTPPMTIRFGDDELIGPVTLASFASGPYVGGMFHIAPDARNDDGQIDLVYAEPATAMRVLKLLPKILRGQHLREADVHRFPLRAATVEAEEPVLSHLDGEIQPARTLFRIDIVPGALFLL